MPPTRTPRTLHDALGLTAVDTGDLKLLLRGLYRGTLECPLGIVGLATHGLQDAANALLGHLRGLPREAVVAVVVAVIAERQDRQREEARREQARLHSTSE